MQNILKFQKEIYDTNVAKGFWEAGQDRNKGEMVMLIITELSEAVEADRKGRRALADKNHQALKFLRGEISTAEYSLLSSVNTDAEWLDCFLSTVKDTVEDEIADTVIRILDYCHGFEIPLEDHNVTGESSGNFAADVLRIVDVVVLMMNKHNAICQWGYVLAVIFKFCTWYNINLEQHVAWKLRYNQSRPHKHGKVY